MKKILLITTGGTIASIATEKGLIPGLTGKQLLENVPSIYNMCEVDVLTLFSIDSTNVYYKHWLKIASTIKENYEKYDGFVICLRPVFNSYSAQVSASIQPQEGTLMMEDIGDDVSKSIFCRIEKYAPITTEFSEF